MTFNKEHSEQQRWQTYQNNDKLGQTKHVKALDDSLQISQFKNNRGPTLNKAIDLTIKWTADDLSNWVNETLSSFLAASNLGETD